MFKMKKVMNEKRKKEGNSTNYIIRDVDHDVGERSP
jgi:hypothetical protein